MQITDFLSRLLRRVATALVVLLALPGFARPSDRDVEKIVLKNGLRVLVARRAETPIFSAHIDVKVGGLEEKPGQSGLAHMLEHMAFKGTSVIGTRDFEKETALMTQIDAAGEALAKLAHETDAKSVKAKTRLKATIARLEKQAEQYRNKGEFERIYEENGEHGLNASTSKDFTSYYVSLPANRLRLWATIESSRFQNPVFREFYPERDVVIQERRERTDNNPMGKFYEVFLQKAYGDYPYAIPTIGSVPDLESLTVKDLTQFFNAYYTPDRMVIALVGDLPERAVLVDLLESTFGSIKRPSQPLAPVLPFVRTQETRFVLDIDAEPALFVGYPKPTVPDLDDMRFDVLAQALCEGDSSRLVKALVHVRQVASSVSCDTGVPGARLPHLFVLSAQPAPGVSPEVLLAAIDEEIEAFKHTPLSRDEIEKVRHQLYASMVWSHESSSELAETLAYYESLTGDWRYLEQFEKQIGRISAKQLQDVAERYLITSVRTVGILKRETVK